MNISIIQRVRAASPDERFTVLADALYDEDPDDDGMHVISVQKVLHQMEKVVFEIGSGPYLRFTPLGRIGRERDVVVISETEDGRIVKKASTTEENVSRYLVYDFLKDYLGLACKSPLSPLAMMEKYSKLGRGEESLSEIVSQSWCDSITLTLLKHVKSQIYNPLS